MILVVHPRSGSWFFTHPGTKPAAKPLPPLRNKTYFVSSKFIGVKNAPDPGSESATLEMFIFGVEEDTWRECLCAELEAEGGEPELVEQLSGQLAADSRAVLEVVSNVKTVP